MKKLLPKFASVVFGLFALAVAGATLFYSFSGLALIFPGDLLGQLFGLVLFDFSLFTWFLVFVSQCRSSAQYVFAGLGGMVGLVGTLGLVGIEIAISSGMMKAADMARPLTYIFVGVLISHLVILYAHHLSGPHINSEINLGVEKARIQDEAIKQAELQLTQNNKALASVIADQLVREVLNDLDIHPAAGQVLDLKALPVDAKPEEPKESGGLRMPDFLSSILSGWARGGKSYGATVQNVGAASPQQTPKQSPAQGVAGPEDIAE